MKIAVCLSGQPRKFELGHSFISKSLSNHEVDYFMHHWFDPSSVGKCHKIYSNTENRSAGKVEQDTDSKIVELFQPKKVFFEKQIDFKDTHNLILNHGQQSKTTQPPEIFISMLYSRWRAGEMLKEYVADTGESYDLVIWTRTDVAPLSDITEEITENSFYHTAYEGPEWNKGLINTSLHASDMQGILHFLNLYNHYKDVYDSGVPFCDHRISFAHISKLKKPFKEILSPINQELNDFKLGKIRRWKWIREDGLLDF